MTIYHDGHSNDGHKQFLAVRMNGCAYDAMLRPSGVSLSSVCLSSLSYVFWLNGASKVTKVTIEYWQRIGSRMWGIDWYKNKWPGPSFRIRLRSRQPLRHISHWIWQKTLAIEACFQRTTNRKRPMVSRMVIWMITSRDPKKVNSWLQYA